MKTIKTKIDLELKRGRMNKALAFGFLILLSVVLSNINLVLAVNDFDQYKPYLHNPSVGNVPKLETFGEYKTELYPGAGTYIYNLAVPRGVLGLQPSIGIFYNSQSVLQRPGILGAGWFLSENSISRNVNYTVNNVSDDYFILSFNNNRLKVLYNGSSWNTEINPNQYRIQNLSSSGEDYWVVTIGDGTKYRFGFNNNSRLDSNTGRGYNVKWNLDLIEDVNGNKIFYNYEQNPFAEDIGTVYISNITYNNDEKKLILFNYESSARPDRRLVYDQGNIIDESRRLSSISIFFDNSLVRRYNMNYVILDDIKSLSSLSNITYFGADNTSTLNTVHFEYYNTSQGFDNATNKWIVPGDFVFSSNSISGQDFGVRFLDVNNDGFPDLVKAKSGESHATSLNNRGNGWDSSSLLVIPSGIEIADGSGVDRGVRFGDVNSDGLIDILVSKEGNAKKVYVNNGTGWTNETGNWPIPINFIGSSSENLGVELVDVNGDGKTDIIWSKEPGTKQVWLNNGSGWANASNDWNIPDFFATSDNKDSGLRILDVNGDGLPDLVRGGVPGNAWFNNGSGWTEHSEYAPNLEFIDHSGSRPDLGVRFIELNGDGLVDIAQNFLANVSIINQTCVDQGNSTEECITGQNITFATNTKLNNGSGWVSAPGWLVPERFVDDGLNIGRRIADVNGDSYPDIAVAYQGPPYENITHIRNATNAFLLKEVIGTYGGKTNIGYTQSTLSNNENNLGFNIWVVKNVSLNNSVGNGFEASSNYSYSYLNGKFDYLDKEFRGFGLVNETLPDSSMVAHFFYQDSILKGREFKTSFYNSQGNHIKGNLNSYSISVDNMIYLNQTSSQIYDEEVIPFVTNITFEYDFYGNVQEINNLGDVDVSGDEKFEVFNYFYNTTNFVVSKPSNYTLFASDDSTVVNQISYFYDNQTSGVILGRLTKVEKSNDHGTDPEMLYGYDSLGNLIRLTDSKGYNTTYIYDSTGTFKMNETNALGYITQYSYNTGTGNLLSEVKDGLSKAFEYDTFGRLTKEIISPDTSESPTTIYTYNLNGIAPESIKVEKKNSNSDYSEVIFFYDGFGNVLQTRTLFSTGTTQIVNNYFYDNSYRVSKIQNPYFDSYSSSLTSPSSDLATNYTYDSLGRVTNITKQDGTSIMVVFDKDLVSQYDENRNRTNYLLDAYGRIKEVQEYDETNVYNTTYSYRQDNTLTNITDTQGNKFIFGYDSLGRRILFDDPNMEPWTYSYDSNGNLINQTDGRNVTTYLTYDPLNRLTFKKAGNSNVTFAYDGQINGTLTNTTSDSNYFNVVHIKYAYDNRLRVSNESIFYCYREVDPGTDECETVNLSTSYDSQDKIINMYLPNTVFDYTYNPIGKLNSINGFLSSINYNAFGSITNKTYNNNLITNIDYDEINRISEIQTGSIQELIYGYDPVGNIKIINDSKNSKLYSMSYDNLNRLVYTQISDLSSLENMTFAYIYDSIGNLISSVSNDKTINFTYANLAHAPSNISIEFTDCGVLDTPDTVYNLETDISSGGTCFIIGADGITINGNGHAINYALVNNGYGIISEGYNGLTIKNLTLYNNRTTSQNSSGIYFANGIDFKVNNANISILGRTSVPNSNNYGIYVYNFSQNIVIDNSVINTSGRGGRGIYMQADNKITNISIFNLNITTNLDGSDAIMINGLKGFINDTRIYNVSINSFNSGIYISGNATSSPNYGGRINISYASIFTHHGSTSCGINLNLLPEDSYISDSNISASHDKDVCLTGSFLLNGKAYFTNATYLNESVLNYHLIRRWYYKAYVNDTNGNNVENANISAYNSSGAYQFNLTTNSLGFTPMMTIIDYVNYGGTKSYYSNYTIYASHANYPTISHQRNVSDLTNIYMDIFTFSSSSIANDTYKFYIKDSLGNNVSWFGSEGNIVLKGSCFAQSNCVTNDGSSFIIGNATDSTTAFINSTGDLCIEQGDCSDLSVSCNPTSDAFIIKNSSSANVAYIDYNGDLCLTGSLFENSNP